MVQTIILLTLTLLLAYFILDTRASAHQPRKGRDHCMKLPVIKVLRYEENSEEKAKAHMTYVGNREKDGVEYRMWVEEILK